MFRKPFKPPLLQRKPQTPQEPQRQEVEANGPPPKKRRLSHHSEDEAVEVTRTLPKASLAVTAPRKPLLPVRNPVAAAEVLKTAASDGAEGYYTVLWRKFTAKKHKTWDGDGVLVVSGGYAYLQDISGRDMGKTSCSTPLLPGSTLSIGSKDVEIDSVISKKEFLAGRPFLGTTQPAKQQEEKPVKANTKVQIKQEKLAVTQEKAAVKFVPPVKNSAANGQFKNPFLATTVMPKSNGTTPQPRHDPNLPGALVMKRPTHPPKGKQIVDVVVDPILTRHLREHQRLGVQFMYECVMGMRPYSGEGAILADEMGLGKTLQTIALLWTLLKQNPIHEDPPVIKKALIVCPVTLINNWRKEFRKWLGNERIGVFVADDKHTRLTDFTMGKSYSVMIIGYEKLRTVQDDLKKGAGIDVVIADEGHRLKTAQNKSAQAIKSLNTERRIILSGTPLQNDLSEFFVMVDFVNPGLLGKYSTFKREFEGPILKSRQPGALAKDVETGEARSKELAEITGQFILRRTADILAKYLPPKTEYAVFCRPTDAQASVYRSVLSSPVFSAVLGSPEATLQLIDLLKKVCNSPSLLNSRTSDEGPSNQTVSALLADIPASLLKSPGASGKLQVLDSLLHRLRTTTQEKVVIVSNWTSTLDILGNLLTALAYPFLRLDGQTPQSKRQGLVDKFNRTPAGACFALLLSAKAGGQGLNLVGASRLVLFDVDWNPATDQQAMARIHRDGQTRPCWIYRLFTSGAIDEKIFQRQLAKRGLAESVVDGKNSVQGFTGEELRDLFRLDESGVCQTHELLGCDCGGRGNVGGDVDESGATTVVSTPAVVSDEEEDEELPDLSRVKSMLVKASQVNMEEQERAIREKRRGGGSHKAKMRVLMQYLHIDAAEVVKGGEEMEALVEDDILLDVLKEEGSRVNFLFAKTSS